MHKKWDFQNSAFKFVLSLYLTKPITLSSHIGQQDVHQTLGELSTVHTALRNGSSHIHSRENT
jgi:hypothetical protein